MLKRMILMLAAASLVIAALGFVKFQKVQEAIAQGEAFQPPPEAVTTIVAERHKWPDTLSAIGTVTAVQGVLVSADLPGIVAAISFESGLPASQGDVLVELDTRQERAQLAAAEAARDLARLNFERLQGLINQRAIAQVEYDRAAAEQKQTEARVAEIQAAIDRKSIRAPFSGILGLRQVNLGQYLSPGEAVVSLQSLDPIYVVFGVPQQEADQVRVGGKVRVRVGEKASLLNGKVSALHAVVDEETRNVQVQATLQNPKGRLRPGMFAQVEMTRGGSRSLIALPASAISYAPYGDSVFVVSELQDPSGRSYVGVQQQFVKLGETRGDQIGILSGLEAGQEVVTSGLFKLYNGAAVRVDNDIQPANERAPHPEDN